MNKTHLNGRKFGIQGSQLRTFSRLRRKNNEMIARNNINVSIITRARVDVFHTLLSNRRLKTRDEVSNEQVVALLNDGFSWLNLIFDLHLEAENRLFITSVTGSDLTLRDLHGTLETFTCEKKPVKPGILGRLFA